MSTNIYWSCEVCGGQVPGEKTACPYCEGKVKTESPPSPSTVDESMDHSSRSGLSVQGQSGRFAEVYEWEEKREARGRGMMNAATPYGIVVGAIVGGIVYLFFSARGDTQTGVTAGLMVGAVVGFWVWQWRYDSGFKMVLDAQRALVAVATEQNTREIVHILKSQPIREEWTKSPDQIRRENNC